MLLPSKATLIAGGLAVAVIISLSLGVWWYKSKSERLQEEKDAAILLYKQTQAALVQQQVSSSRQINSLEEEAKAALKRSQELTSQLNEVYSNDEKVSCPVPGFVQHVIDGMH